MNIFFWISQDVDKDAWDSLWTSSGHSRNFLGHLKGYPWDEDMGGYWDMFLGYSQYPQRISERYTGNVPVLWGKSSCPRTNGLPKPLSTHPPSKKTINNR